ncbi:hypothetical protein [Catenovulum agarivorans]|uniref:hypothetical protein n=1 Tax=Catenovulum agarivorans TaxID=1172192 RepID=UPI0002D8A499|nr:hypothetical protein [Catenovulum agarivorans]
MENAGELISSLFALAFSIAAFVYYSNPKKSKCYDCQEVISIHKENRFSLTVNGEEHALCKKCYNKRYKQESLPAQNCFCCGKQFSTRMKILEWDVYPSPCYLCVTCNKKGESKLKTYFLLPEIFPDQFIESHTSFSNLQEYVDSSKIKISEFNDLETEEWNLFVVKTTDFDSWESMKTLALSELYRRHRKQVIEELCKSA